jgi:glucose-1-phosphate thymidylyltransferase
VIGYLGDQIKEYVSAHYDFKLNFVEQKELGGLGHAIWMTREIHKGSTDPLLIVLGDTLFAADFDKIIGADSSYLGVKEVADARRFGVIMLEGDRIKAMVEKPANPPTNLAIVGIYYLKNGGLLFDCLDELIDSGSKTAGEFQLTDALQKMLDKGEVMKPFEIDGWFDCGKPETLLQTNADLLAHNKAGEGIAADSIAGSLLKPPFSIGKGVTIENSIIGPNASIGDGVTIKNSIVQNTVVSPESTIENLVLDGSIIGHNVQASSAARALNIGHTAEIRI